MTRGDEPECGKLLFLVTEDWYFCSHRLALGRAARRAGYEVVVATRIQGRGERIRQAGLRPVPIRMRRRGHGLFDEFCSLLELVRLYRRERPAIVHHVALKPVVFGGIAAWLAGVPRVVDAVAGLGYVFTSDDRRARWVRPVLRALLRLLLGGRRHAVIVQNPEDARMLAGLSKAIRPRLIRGAGVDLRLFRPAGRRRNPRPIVVLPARMLVDKGVGEFVEAARRLRTAGVPVRMVLVGDRDADNPAAIPGDVLAAWHRECVVEWWGRRDDMPRVHAQADVVCLPSYREGLPKVLLEAAAAGRAIVTTDVPGCREVVRHGHNGLLVPPRDAASLAWALRALIDDRERRQTMGRRGREFAARYFSDDRVAAETLAVYRE